MRPGRVEVYRDGVSSAAAQKAYYGAVFLPGTWRWRFFAANGVQIGGSTERYNRLRDVAHNLEQNFPGYRLLDQDRRLDGPEWFLWGMRFAYEDEGSSEMIVLPVGLVLGMGMRGVRIPVTSPVNLGSRR